MDFADDEDIFADSLGDLSDIDVLECNVVSQNSSQRTGGASTETNPVKDHLLKQLSEVSERVESTRRQIAETIALKTKVLHKFSSRAFYGESSSSDSESDLYTVAGEPIVKQRNVKKRQRKQPLAIQDIWQHVLDDKWVVGVMFENRSNWDLYDLDLHTKITDASDFFGVATFWTQDSNSFWRRSSVVQHGSKVVATIVLDLPNFGSSSRAEMFATVAYDLNGKALQTLVPKVNLTVDNIRDGLHRLRIDNVVGPFEKTRAILSLKSLGVQRRIDVEISEDLPFAQDLDDIFEHIGFAEASDRTYYGRGDSVDRCILEISSMSAVKFNAVIYARSTAQLNIFLRLLHHALPTTTSIACSNVSAAEVIQALENELDVYLTMGNAAELSEAIVKTDLICNEFENGRKIFRPLEDED